MRILVFLGLLALEIGGPICVWLGFIKLLELGMNWGDNLAFWLIVFPIVLLAPSLLIVVNWQWAGRICKKVS